MSDGYASPPKISGPVHQALLQVWVEQLNHRAEAWFRLRRRADLNELAQMANNLSFTRVSALSQPARELAQLLTYLGSSKPNPPTLIAMRSLLDEITEAARKLPP